MSRVSMQCESSRQLYLSEEKESFWNVWHQLHIDGWLSQKASFYAVAKLEITHHNINNNCNNKSSDLRSSTEEFAPQIQKLFSFPPSLFTRHAVI
jgi:hypothetical protein